MYFHRKYHYFASVLFLVLRLHHECVVDDVGCMHFWTLLLGNKKCKFVYLTRALCKVNIVSDRAKYTKHPMKASVIYHWLSYHAAKFQYAAQDKSVVTSN